MCSVRRVYVHTIQHGLAWGIKAFLIELLSHALAVLLRTALAALR